MDKIITLAGEVSHPELLRMLQRSRIFLHTSNYEGFGIVCLEALYAGAQVVSFVRVMKTDIGIHVAKDLDDIIRIVDNLLNPEMGYAQHSLPYSADSTVAKFMQLIK